MKKLVFAAAASLAGLASAAQAGGCDSPFCHGGGRGAFGFGRAPMPAFQAAPWYLYWPYNQHFMTPAPIGGAYSAPPMGYGGLVNPYFPGGHFPGGGYNYPPPNGAVPPTTGGGSYTPPPSPYTPPVTPPAPMPPLGTTPGVTPAPGGAIPPVTPAPSGATPPVTPAPGGATPPVTPPGGVSNPVPGVIRTASRR